MKPVSKFWVSLLAALVVVLAMSSPAPALPNLVANPTLEDQSHGTNCLSFCCWTGTLCCSSHRSTSVCNFGTAGSPTVDGCPVLLQSIAAGGDNGAQTCLSIKQSIFLLKCVPVQVHFLAAVETFCCPIHPKGFSGYSSGDSVVICFGDKVTAAIVCDDHVETAILSGGATGGWCCFSYVFTPGSQGFVCLQLCGRTFAVSGGPDQATARLGDITLTVNQAGNTGPPAPPTGTPEVNAGVAGTPLLLTGSLLLLLSDRRRRGGHVRSNEAHGYSIP